MPGYETWIDRQVREAMERGEFDNLPGAGKPIPGLGRPDNEDWWVQGLLERENLRPVLPGSLSLRKEVAQIEDAVADVRTEREVRELVANLNARVIDARRRGVDGPAVVVRTVDVEDVVAAWQSRRL